MTNLLEHRHKIHSQFGEEGIIKALYTHFGFFSDPPWFVEIGAGDGISQSNTRFLAEMGHHGVHIEANMDRAAACRNNALPGTIVVAKSLPWSGLDIALDAAGCPEDVGVLSLDVDGDEYHFLKVLRRRPKIVVVEINPSIPYWVEFIQRPGDFYGCSALSMMRLMRSRGYQLVCYDLPNCFFIPRNEVWTLNTEKNFSRLFNLGTSQGVEYVLSSYGGKRHAQGLRTWGADSVISESAPDAEVFIEHVPGDIALEEV